MKNKIILTGLSFLMVIGFVSSQICPTPSSRAYNQRVNNYTSSLYNFNSSGFNDLAFSFNSIIKQGYRTGNLTLVEIRNLENQFRKVQREIRFATIDGRLSYFERSDISNYIRRLERNIEREWYDKDTRLS